MHEPANNDGRASADAHLTVHKHVALLEIATDKLKAFAEVTVDVVERAVVDFDVHVFFRWE